MNWEPVKPLFSLGQLEVSFFGVFAVMAFLLAYTLFNWQLLRAGAEVDDGIESISYAVLGSVVGARGAQILLYDWDEFVAGPLHALTRGEFSVAGAIFGLFAALVVFARSKKVPITEVFDRYSFAAAGSFAVIALADFFRSADVGKVANLAWAMRFPGYDAANDMNAPLRHPTQLYDLFVALAAISLLLFLDKKWNGEERPRGMLTGVFLLSCFAGRALVDVFRETERLFTIASYPLSGWLSLLAAAIGAVVLLDAARSPVRASWSPARASAADSSDGD